MKATWSIVSVAAALVTLLAALALGVAHCGRRAPAPDPAQQKETQQLEDLQALRQRAARVEDLEDQLRESAAENESLARERARLERTLGRLTPTRTVQAETAPIEAHGAPVVECPDQKPVPCPSPLVKCALDLVDLQTAHQTAVPIGTLTASWRWPGREDWISEARLLGPDNARVAYVPPPDPPRRERQRVAVLYGTRRTRGVDYEHRILARVWVGAGLYETQGDEFLVARLGVSW